MRLRGALKASAILLFVAASTSAYIWLARRSLHFNAEGRYFDEVHGVVIQEQSLTVASVAAVLFALFAILCWIMARRF